MYRPMQDDYPQTGYPQGSYGQGGYSSPGAFAQGGNIPQGAATQGAATQGAATQGAATQGAISPQGPTIQGGYPSQGPTMQGGYPSLGPIMQGGYPSQGSTPQGSFPSQGPIMQGDYPNQADLGKEGVYPPGVCPLQPGFQPGYPSEGYGMPTSGYAAADLGEDADIKGFDFNEKSIRRAFIRKVYAILMAQLLVTLAVISVFTFHERTKLWVMRNPMILLIALIVTLVCVISMSCCESARRKAPMNFILLALFTLAESFLLGVVSSKYDSNVVMMAVGITAAICFALTLFAMQTRFDFTVIGGGLFCALLVLMLFGLIAIFIPKSTILTLVYASAGALVFSLYLIYDTQLMMGGNHKYTISPEEYIFAALSLYLDVINIFLYILRIIAASRG